MATKKEDKGPSMIETFKEFKETKNIDRTTLVSVLEESLRNVLAKQFGSDENFDVIVNPDKGDLEIHRNRIVVADGEVQDENKEISLTQAQKIEPDYEVGEEVSEEVRFEKFGRRAILNLRQTLASKILELEHDSLYNKYKDRVGQVISAEVYQMWKREVLLIDDEGNELHLPSQNRFPTTTTARAKPYVPSSRRCRTRTTIRVSSSHAPALCSLSVCSKPKCPKSTTVSSQSVAWHACQENVQRWL